MLKIREYYGIWKERLDNSYPFEDCLNVYRAKRSAERAKQEVEKYAGESFVIRPLVLYKQTDAVNFSRDGMTKDENS